MNSTELNKSLLRTIFFVSSATNLYYIPDKPKFDGNSENLCNNNNDIVNKIETGPSINTYYTTLFSYIEKNIIGRDKGFRSPFGDRLILYCDYTASARALKFIEEFIYNEVLPEYANTHTTNTITSLQTTMFRHEARDIIRNACHASDLDAVLFVGSGCTGAIHKLIHNLNLIKPPIVIVGPFEHHSNLLPWRHLAREVHRIKINNDGGLDIDHLESVLKVQSVIAINEQIPLIGTFSAVSNVTGIISNVNMISALVHKYHGVVFWDYAAGAPYLPIDMNPIITGEDRDYVYKDAIYFSMHKFIGGVQSTGILIAKKALFLAGENYPEGTGGGTVYFVRRENQIYLKDTEEREEGGTPNILGSIRAGLAFQLKDSANTDAIVKRENYLVKLAWSKFSNSSKNLIILGGHHSHRLPIFSFLIRHEIRKNEYLFLHHNFVCSLLNDLFGIQSRSGCACAGPYAMDLIGMNEELANTFENVLVGSGLEQNMLSKYFDFPHREILRPGFVRINFPYYMPDSEVKFVLDAIKFIAKHGHKFLVLYMFNPITSQWKHRDHEIFKDRKWLNHISYKRGYMTWRKPNLQPDVTYPANFPDIMKEVKNIMSELIKNPVELQDENLGLDESIYKLRWFLLPSEVSTMLWNTPMKITPSKAPFTPGSIVEVFIGKDKPETLVETVEIELQNHEVVEEFKEIPVKKISGTNKNQNAYNQRIPVIDSFNGSSLKDIYLKNGYEEENVNEIVFTTKESNNKFKMLAQNSVLEMKRNYLIETEIELKNQNNSHNRN